MILLWERYVSAMVFLWGRVRDAVWWLIHGPTRPERPRMLFDWEVRAIERECGIGLDEPGYQPNAEAVAIVNEDPAYRGERRLRDPFPLPIDAGIAETWTAKVCNLTTIQRLAELERPKPRPNLPLTARMERR